MTLQEILDAIDYHIVLAADATDFEENEAALDALCSIYRLVADYIASYQEYGLNALQEEVLAVAKEAAELRRWREAQQTLAI